MGWEWGPTNGCFTGQVETIVCSLTTVLSPLPFKITGEFKNSCFPGCTLNVSNQNFWGVGPW